MAITRFRNSSILNRGPKYNDFLAGLPFRPIIGTATDGGTGTTVSVAFTGNNPAGAGITYTALSSPGNLTATGPASPITVSGLTAGTAYTFQVKAGNSLGDSAYSAASNSVTPVQPTAFESIASTTLGSDTETVTFTNIPGTYQHLQVRIMTRLSLGYNTPNMYFNNTTTGSVYDQHDLTGSGSSASASASTSRNNLQFDATGTAQTSNVFGVTIVDIHDYASTTKNKTVRMLSGWDNNGSGTIALRSGLWRSTSAINRIDFTTGFGAGYYLITGTVISLYGIKGA